MKKRVLFNMLRCKFQMFKNIVLRFLNMLECNNQLNMLNMSM